MTKGRKNGNRNSILVGTRAGLVVTAFVTGVVYQKVPFLWSCGESRLENLGSSVSRKSQYNNAPELDDSYVQLLSQEYQVWPNDGHGWCPHPIDLHRVYGTNSSTGILFVKNHKAASSTGAGITLQIARNVARRKFRDSLIFRQTVGRPNTNMSSLPSPEAFWMCPNQFRHAYSARGDHAHRDHDASFLWTTVRHPASKALSSFFFFSVSRSGRPATSQGIIAALGKHKNRQVDLLAVSERPFANVSNTTESTRSEILQWMSDYLVKQYNFMAVVERLDESLVVLKHLLRVEWQDLIVLSSKQSGSYFPGDSSDPTRCVLLQSPFTTPAVDDYITTEFHKDNWDYYLYAAANRSLDRAIQTLGSQKVEEEVRYLRALRHLAEKTCLSQAKFPCTSDGYQQVEASAESCYAEDCGCGYQCVDRVLHQTQ